MRRLLLFAVVALLAACSTIDCPVQNKVALNFAVKKYNSSGVEVTDTLILNRAIGKTSFSLPLSYTQPEDALIFGVDASDGSGGVLDTVWIKKEDIPHFESVDCQASYFHTITEVNYSRHLIDSIVINNPHVTYDTTEPHFYLYLKARR